MCVERASHQVLIEMLRHEISLNAVLTAMCTVSFCFLSVTRLSDCFGCLHTHITAVLANMNSFSQHVMSVTAAEQLNSEYSLLVSSHAVIYCQRCHL
jgi:capsular polysaccharide biosynthesis protein